MQDFTKGSVGRHLLQLAAFIALSTVFQTLYFLADLYFVGRLGKEAIAGVSLGGNLSFLVLALTQSLGVGTTSLIAQAIGRKDREGAEVIFNQSLVLSNLTGLTFGVVIFGARNAYCHRLAADALTASLGVQYLAWFIPALFLQFVLIAMGSALRGLGDLKIPTAIQVLTVVLNIALAPVLIFGWGTGHPFGVTGAALASFIAIAVGCVLFTAYFRRDGSDLQFRVKDWRPRPRLWGQILRIGLPAGGEFALIGLYLLLVYDIIRPFGSAAQAGFGIGGRVMQSLFLPALAIAFATAPVVGQNFGARQGDRVRRTFYSACGLSAAIMLMLTLFCHLAPEAMVCLFNCDRAVVAFGSEYLRIISWNFLATGIIFVSSGVFQGMGNTLPSLACSSIRLLLFALPAYLLSRHPSFQMAELWYLSVASVAIQMCATVSWMHIEFKRKLLDE